MRPKKDYSFLLLVVLCSVAGVVLGGTSSWAESNRCLLAEVVPTECLTKSPQQKTMEGMGVGLVAGVGAAIGAAWQVKGQMDQEK